MENSKNLKAEVKLLKAGFFVLLSLNIIFMLFAFNDDNGVKDFKEINAQRINIVGENKKIVMAISNNKLISGVSMNGKTYPKEFSDGRENMNGILFYNQYGDEVGGLIYNGLKRGDSGYSAVGHLSFDQWKQNQVVALQYLDNGKSRRAGLRIYDRPTNVPMDIIFDRLKKRNELTPNTPAYDSIVKEIRAANDRGENGVERMFIGSLNETAQILLKDKNGNTKIKIYVDKDGEAKMEFLDAAGKVVKSFPN
ncbi:MAG TPA: hypothetical protein VFN30_12580 [Chitinophagaceae bacterium]|nr:hypothetical protein [Chitinophagaceae bacterium]